MYIFWWIEDKRNPFGDWQSLRELWCGHAAPGTTLRLRQEQAEMPISIHYLNLIYIKFFIHTTMVHLLLRHTCGHSSL